MPSGSFVFFWFIFMEMITRTLTNSVGKWIDCFLSLFWPYLLRLRSEQVLLVSFSSLHSNTLCAPEVISLINTRMLFWACSTNRPEGYRGKLCFIYLIVIVGMSLEWSGKACHLWYDDSVLDTMLSCYLYIISFNPVSTPERWELYYLHSIV